VALRTGLSSCQDQLRDASAAAAHQLGAFGAAVCAALPTAQCCDYHGCSNVGARTEQQLVSGKSSVCSGCKVAREPAARTARERTGKTGTGSSAPCPEAAAAAAAARQAGPGTTA